jgi:hypothetical protein
MERQGRPGVRLLHIVCIWKRLHNSRPDYTYSQARLRSSVRVRAHRGGKHWQIFMRNLRSTLSHTRPRIDAFTTHGKYHSINTFEIQICTRLTRRKVITFHLTRYIPPYMEVFPLGLLKLLKRIHFPSTTLVLSCSSFVRKRLPNACPFVHARGWKGGALAHPILN